MTTNKRNIIKMLSNVFIVVLFAVSFSSVAYADYSTTTVLNTSGSFVVPQGVTGLTFSVVGGGGGGGGGAFTFAGGGGGSASAILNTNISVTPGQTISYTVGNGGNGGYGGSMQFAGGNGTNGGSTSFGSTTVSGGFGGQGAAYGNPSSGIGGLAGGIGGSNGTNGDTFFGQRVKGGNGGSNALGTAGVGGSGNSSSYVLATAGTNGAGGGGASGWQFNSNGTADAGATGGNGSIVVSYYADLTAPVITILGSNPETITVGTPYADAGAIALDNIDGTTTVATVSNNVDINTVGTYEVVYSATDTAGNNSMATRTVNVIAAPDTIAPVITILGSNPATTTVGSTYVDAGATAFDNVDGTTTVNIASNDVDTNATGTYSVVYTSTDSSGNTATATRVVIVGVASPVDTTAPTAPLISTTTAATGTITLSEDIAWFDSTDLESGVAYYLYLWDNSSATVLSTTTAGVSTTTSTTTNLTAFGTYWFHVAAVDNAGNVSLTTTYGPFLISDSNVLYVNSTIGGTLYSLFSPSLAEAAIASTTGATTIVNSSISVWWDINDSNVINTTVNDVAMNLVDATNSTLINDDIGNCQIINSDVENYYLRNCYVAFSVLDPSTLYSFTNSTSTNSQIYASNIDSSTIDHSYVATSTIGNSNISFSTTTDSTVASSTISNGSIISSSTVEISTVDNSNVSSSTVSTSTVTDSSIVNSTFTNSASDNSTTTDSAVDTSSLTNSTVSSSSATNSTITDSTLTNSTSTDSTITSSNLDTVVVASSTIASSTIADATITDAIIIDNTIYSGTITYNGTTTVISTSTPLGSLIEYAPVAAFSVATSNLQMNITDNTVDLNSGTVFPDSWTYMWDFGDGTSTTVLASTTGQNISYTYATSGTYTVSLTVTDGYGKVSTTSSQVTIVNNPDTIAPVITILGSNPDSVVAGTTYTDAGATAFDNVDGTTTVATISNNVDTLTLGTYQVVYSATDTAGNNATATRTVNVVSAPDTIPPVITINGSSTVNVFQNSTYTDQGATAFDNVDGTTSVSISFNDVDTSATGTYSVVYSSTDSSSNTAYATRTVDVIGAPGDVVPPVITITNGTPTTVLQNSTYVDDGATAFDNVDGTTSVATIFNDVDTAATGTYSVVYSATDTAGNNSQATRTVDVIAGPTDNTPPVITITNGTPTTVLQNSTYVDDGATAFDNVDGTTSVATIFNDVDTAATGTYSVVYSATDTAGNNSQATRNVNVVEATSSDNIPPVITIINGTPTTITVGSVYTDAGATAFDNIDGTTTVTTISNNVDSNTVGTYQVVYSATDVAGNNATATRDVNVISGASDNTPPVITITNGTPTTVLQNSTYVDDGATAFDNVDGTTSVATIFNDVDTAATGTYSVVYSATDTAGNNSQATRIVNVIDQDTVAPVITILGNNPETITQYMTYTDAGAVAFDNVDGSTTVTIISNNVDTSATGTYSVVYSATDMSGNAATATRTVNVTADTQAPVITILGNNPENVLLNSVYTDAGATAFDNVDGTTTVNATGTVDTAATGTYQIVYSSTDSSSNTAYATRTVDVIAASSSAKQILSFDFNGLSPAATGTINQISGTINLTVPSGTNVTNLVPTISLSASASVNPGSGAANDFTNPVVYTVTAQDLSTSTYTVTVTVATTSTSTPDTTAPAITILGSNPVTLTVGSSYTDAGATAFDNVDGVTTVTIASNDVNTSIAGLYHVVYTSTDSSSNTSFATRTVNIISTSSNSGGQVTIFGGVPGPYVPPTTPTYTEPTPSTPVVTTPETPAAPTTPQTPANNTPSAGTNNSISGTESSSGNQASGASNAGNSIDSALGGIIGTTGESQGGGSTSAETATTAASTTANSSNKSLVATVLEGLSSAKALWTILILLLIAVASYITFRHYSENESQNQSQNKKTK